MKIQTPLFSGIGILTLSGLLLFGCTPKPTATPASTPQIKQQIQDSSAPLTLVHLWATWCAPCREEFPELIKIQRNYSSRGVSIILISADDPNVPSTVETFLRQQACPIDSLIAVQLDQEFIETLSPNWSGALPSTIFFDAKGTRLKEWEGRKNYAHYAETIEVLLEQTKGATP